jgi:molecular chaperone DnaK (HSP70)
VLHELRQSLPEQRVPHRSGTGYGSTADAAKAAGLGDVTLLEEPQAAFLDGASGQNVA